MDQTKKCSTRISANSEVKTKKKKVFISKNARFSTNSGFYLKNRANFHEFCGEDQNKVKFYEFWGESIKTTKKQFLLTNSRAIISILEVSGLDLHFSTTESVSFFGTQSLLGGVQFLFGGTQAVIWGDTTPECHFVAPGLESSLATQTSANSSNKSQCDCLSYLFYKNNFSNYAKLLFF